KMMVYNGSQLESVEEGEAVAVPGPPPEPRAPEPGAPVPEPGLDLSLSPRSESPGRGRPNCSPGRRKGRGGREKPEAPQDLGAPVQQSSLALSLELQAARAAAGGQFDAAKAVEEQLRKSFQTRCGLEESVTEGIQFPFPSTTLFVLQQEPPGPGPDMTILCDPETLFYESPHLTLEGLPPLRLQLRPRPSEDTFLMHRTLRRWEA
ncbi:hypothetical protein M91_05956, partial [Bos mutus]